MSKVNSNTLEKPAMKYICLIYDEESKIASLPAAEFDALMGDYMSFTKDIATSGHLIVGEELEPTSSATTVRIRKGKISTTDGPFAETKEQLGGFYLIEARDLNEAIQIASRIPSAKIGSIEVRPIREHNES
jgi:hypothetical protein